jgi:heptosyltransferase-2
VLPQELFNLLPKKFIACNPGGGNAHSPANNRMWPIEYYAELINNSSLPFVILGQGSSDRDLVDKLIQLVEPKKIVSLVGKATLSETALILKHAALYLGNDSALMFLGAAMGVQTLGLYGPTQVEAANPIGKKQYNIRSEVACSPCYDPYSGINGKMYTCTNNLCMQEIKVKTVLDKITKLLASKVGIL